MHATDGFSWVSPTATSSGTFTLDGGAYIMDAVAAWNSGSITLQRLGPDGSTYITAATALSADGTSGGIVLSKGTYKFLVASASALSVSVVRVPGE